MGPACEFDVRVSCPNSCVIGFRMCIKHLQSSRGYQHAREIIDSGALFTYRDLDEEIKSRSEAPLQDYHTTALEQMAAALSEQQRFADDARNMLYSLNPADWRYTDRHGQEQTRMEVTLYERAQDRLARMVERASKMALEEKIVSLGRQQTELVIRLAMGTIEDLGLDAAQFDEARTLLLDRFRREAHLSARHEAQVSAELEAMNAPKAIVQ